MPALGFRATLASLKADGTALTAASRGSLTQGTGATGARFSLLPNMLRIGDVIGFRAGGRISSAVTTPGTARFDLGFGGTANFDTLAMALNIVAQTNVPWVLDVWGVVREIGATANIFWQGLFMSTAGINTAAVATGPWAGAIPVPYNTAPVIGANFDHTATLAVDLSFTQTVATGSCTMHTYYFYHESYGV